MFFTLNALRWKKLISSKSEFFPIIPSKLLSLVHVPTNTTIFLTSPLNEYKDVDLFLDDFRQKQGFQAVTFNDQNLHLDRAFKPDNMDIKEGRLVRQTSNDWFSGVWGQDSDKGLRPTNKKGQFWIVVGTQKNSKMTITPPKMGAHVSLRGDRSSDYS